MDRSRLKWTEVNRNEPKCDANVTKQKHINNKYYNSTLDII